MLAAIEVVSVQLGRLSALQDELNQFKTVALVLRTIVTVEAEVAEDKMGSLLQYHMIKALEVKLVQRGLFYAKRNLTLIEVTWQVNQEKSQLLPKRGRQVVSRD